MVGLTKLKILKNDFYGVFILIIVIKSGQSLKTVQTTSHLKCITRDKIIGTITQKSLTYNTENMGWCRDNNSFNCH